MNRRSLPLELNPIEAPLGKVLDLSTNIILVTACDVYTLALTYSIQSFRVQSRGV